MTRKLPLLLFALLLVAPLTVACAAEPPAPTTEEEKTAYAVGLMISKNLANLDLSDAEFAQVQRAIADARAGKEAVKLEEYAPKVQAMAQERAGKRTAAEKEKGKAYAEKAAQEAGAVKTPSGLVYLETQAGTGASPSAHDKVKVHYRGTLIDGTEFDSSIKRGQPAEFELTGVIPCWTEALEKMKVGGKAKIVCPPEIAYGDRGRPSIPGGATLVFEVELLEVGQ